MKKIGVMVGSLRKASWNRKIANVLMQVAPASLSMETLEIGQLPFYNQDLEEQGPPKEWALFREKAKGLDGVLLVTPEYNRSVAPALKNALDVGSMPYGKSVWGGKPCAVVSASPGGIGGFGSNHHVRQSFVFLDMPCMQQPEAYIGQVHTLFDSEGKKLKQETQEFLRKYMAAYAIWVDSKAKVEC